MKQALAIAAALTSIGLFSAPARAGDYIVNGHDASREQVQDLTSHNAQPGRWTVDRHGISSANSESTNAKWRDDNIDRGCWYDADLPHCD